MIMGTDGGDDGPDTGGGSRHGAGEIRVIAFLLHSRDKHSSHAYRIGKGRSGNTGKQHRCSNIGNRKAACDVAHNLITKTDQTLRNTALVHQGAGKHEARDTQQGKRIQSCKKSLYKHVQGHIVSDKIEQRRNAKAEGNRNAQGQTYNETNK